MKTLFGYAAVFAAGAAFAAAAFAAETPAPDDAAKDSPACLQSSRLWGFNVVNQRTLVLSDIQNNKFTVRMTGGCIGLTNIIDDLRLVTKTSLGCLSQGDRVSFREPTLGRMTCFVTSVEPQKPEPKS
jgi:hypothetical protein